MPRAQRIALYAGPALGAVVLGLLNAQGLDPKASWTAAVTVLCAVWWVFEPISMPATALIPFAAFPLTGVLSHTEVARSYGHTLVLLMLGGAIISTAMEKSRAHRRVALGMVHLVGGTGGPRLVLGFLLASAALSMWISNTATAVMLLPVALAVLEYHGDQSRRLAMPLLLAVAYGASIGGSATPIGTPPNVIMMGQYEQATGETITFVGWMRVGVPFVLVMLPIVWLWLTRGMTAMQGTALPKLGEWRPDERRVLMVFAVAAVAWCTRSAPFGGWGSLIGAAGTVGDSTVALTAVVALFLLPSGTPEGGRLLDWETARRIPWGVFIMIGGGLAIGQAFNGSGLSEDMGQALAPLTSLPLWGMIAVVCLFSTFLTEITSNTAVASIIMPVLAGAAVAAGIDPWLLMVPATMALNWAFMLPVAAAPNAIVYGPGHFTTAEMAREGVWLNLMGTVVITILSLWVL